jgi:hypothetical protein
MKPIVYLIVIGFQLIFAAVQITAVSLYILLILPFVALWKVRKPLCRIIIRLPALIRGMIFYARLQWKLKAHARATGKANLDRILHPETYLGKE